MRYEHVDDVMLHTYIDRYIGIANSPLLYYYSCIGGSLRLAPNYCTREAELSRFIFCMLPIPSLRGYYPIAYSGNPKKAEPPTDPGA